MNNVELTRAFWRVWDEDGLGALLTRYDEFFTEDAEWRPPISQVSGERYVGRQGFERYVADVEESLRDTGCEIQEVAEIAPGVIRSRVRFHGEGSASGAVIDAPMVGVARLRDGRVYWAWGSYDIAKAEKAAEALARGEKVEV